MRSMKNVLLGILLVFSLGISAQQPQTTTTTTPQPVAHKKVAQSGNAASAAPAAKQAPASQSAAPVPLSNNNHYVNSSGNVVHSPAKAPSVPPGATAVCGDGTYSFSQHRQGTCSHHSGVARWL
jgi:hypothetical protein